MERLAEAETSPGERDQRPPTRPGKPNDWASPHGKMRPGLPRIFGRDHEEAESQYVNLTGRITRSERRLSEIDAAITEGDLGRAQLEENLGTSRSHLAEFEMEQESARESRVHWQVQEAHIAGEGSVRDRAIRASCPGGL